MTDLIEVGDAMLPEHFDPMVVTDVSVDGLVTVFCFYGDFRGEVAFEIECNDFSFVSMAPDRFPVSRWISLIYLLTTASQTPNRTARSRSWVRRAPLIEGFIDPADEAFFSEGDRIESVGDACGIDISDKREHDRFNPGSGDGFPSLWEFVDGHSHPDQTLVSE